MKRESFGSRLGFLLVSAGCAIGIGNVWRFPYITGQNGGGYFVLFYLICLVIMGIPVLTMELAVGRAGRKSAVLAYRALEKPGQKWHIHGWFCLLGCCLLMMYYTTVTGWMVSYFGRFAFGSFRGGMATEEVSAVFGQMLSSPMEMGVLAMAVVIVGFLVCSFGLEKGLERVTKVMMLALLVLIVVLVKAAKAVSGVNELVETANQQLKPTLENVNAMVEGVTPSVKTLGPALEKVDPLVDRVQLTVDTVNLELLRVDGILEDVEQVTDVAGNAATTVNNLVSAPSEAVAGLLDRVKGAIDDATGATEASNKRFVYPVGKGKKDQS